MSEKKYFPDGTTWQQVYDAFDELAKEEVPGAVDATLTVEAISHGGRPEMELEPEMLDLFRDRYRVLLMARETM